MAQTVRRLTADDLAEAYDLGRRAFGGPREAPASRLVEQPARTTWAVADGAGRLLAKAVDREQQHWFGGRLVPATGIAGVAVDPEARGRGVARTLLVHLLRAARERGAAIATLFPTAPALYRAIGCEQVGALTWWRLPTSDLARLRPVGDVALRRADDRDVEAIIGLYEELARSGNGLLERRGPLFDTTASGVVHGHDGVTLAVGPDGTVEGCASWDREGGYDASGVVEVADLIGRTSRATAALLAMLGTWTSVAPTLHLRLPDDDPAWLLLPGPHVVPETRHPWMLRVLDPPAAVASRGWPPGLRAAVDLELVDDVLPEAAGRWRLVVEDGAGRLEAAAAAPAGRPVRLGPRGLAVLVAGAAEPTVLRRAGLLEGGDERTDALLRAASAGPRPALLDYF